MNGNVISASEMERYGYCPLSWWLGREGVDAEGKEVEGGLTAHREMGDSLRTLIHEENRSRETSSALIWLAAATMGLLMVALITMWFLELVVGQVLLIMVLVWMLVLAYLLYRLLVSTEVIDSLRDEFNLGEGTIETPDGLDRSSPVLKSQKYNLCGRPDYLLKEDDLRIPVEVKTGRPPRAPFFSHILQIGAYCLLVEEVFDQKPPRGQVRYGFEEEPHDIVWDAKLKALVLEKLEEMNQILASDLEAHRNHNRAGKCHNCSRKQGCPERLGGSSA